MNSKTKINLSFGNWMAIIFFLGLFMAMFFKDLVFSYVAPEAVEISDGKRASQEIAKSILQLDRISFDTNSLKTEYFQQILILPTFPTDSKTLSNFGKNNPFLGNFQIVSTPVATTTIFGGVVNASQRSVNSGRSIAPIVNGQAQTPDGRR